MADLKEISLSEFNRNLEFLKTLFSKSEETRAGLLDQINGEFRLAREMSAALRRLSNMESKKASRDFDYYTVVLAIWLLHQEHDPEITKH
jgi:hypothetical protein